MLIELKYGNLVKPDTHAFFYKKRRKSDISIDKVIDALNALHNKESCEEYRRNPETLNLLKTIEIIHPPVTKALDLEKELFFEFAVEVDCYLLNKFNKRLNKISIGGYWYQLLGEPVSIWLPSGQCEVSLRTSDNESSYYCHGEGYSQTKNCDRIHYNNEWDK